MMVPSSTSRRSTIALGIAGAVFAAAVLVLILLGWITMREYTLAVERGEALRKSINESVVLAETRSTLLETKPTRDQLNSYFVTEGSEVTFLEEIESLGEEANVSVTFSSIGKHADGPSPELRVSFRTEGLWRNTMHFVALLESLPRKITIREVSFSEIVNEGGASRWHASFSISLKSFTPTSLQQ